MKMKSLKQCENLLEVFLFLENAFLKGCLFNKNSEINFYHRQLMRHIKPYKESLINNNYDTVVSMYDLINHLKITRKEFETLLINLSDGLVLKRPQ